MNAKESYLHKVNYWKDSAHYWDERLEEYNEILKNEDLSEGKRERYEALKVVAKEQGDDCKKFLKQLLTKGEIEYEETEEEKALFKKLYKKWKKEEKC